MLKPILLMNTTPIYYNLNAVYLYIYLIFCKLWLESTQQNWLEFVIYNFFILPRFFLLVINFPVSFFS